MANKISRSMVALSASAVASIYAAGFILTRSADAGLAAASASITPAPVLATATAQPSVSPAVVGASASPTSVSTPTQVAAAPSPTATPSATSGLAASASPPANSVAPSSNASGYSDGTFTGQGTSRRGGMSVSVTIQGGTITNVQITNVTTQYPVSRVASLPGIVVKQQSANVNVISGATYSSQAFTQAVQQALTLAKASSAVVA